MEIFPESWSQKARDLQKQNRETLKKFASVQGNMKRLNQFHDEAFGHIECMNCANCCKTLGPRFKTTDIKRISRHLRMKESHFIETYLKVDEDADYVAKSLPCPFLDAENFCSIYSVRPGDCKNYPYTDSDLFFKKPGLSALNAQSCPAAYVVLEKIKDALAKKKA